jgi:exodeoxyribonuclease III
VTTLRQFSDVAAITSFTGSRPNGRQQVSPQSKSMHSLLLEPMKIASFNINNINRRLTNLLDWLREAEPDIVCLQELKAADTEFPAEAIRQAGYHGVWRGERSWNGVAILTRWAPVVTRTDLPGDDGDRQCRYLEAAVNGVLVASIYAPNGNPQPGSKFDYKLAWLKRLNAHAAELYATGAPVVLAGDYNVVPTDFDIYPTKSWDHNALLQPREPRGVSTPSRARLDRFCSRAPSQRADVHLLGLQAEPLGTRWRSASRPHPFEFRSEGAPA